MFVSEAKLIKMKYVKIFEKKYRRLNITFSKILLQTFNKEIGRKFDSSNFDPSLWSGKIFAFESSAGKLPFSKEILIIEAK